MTQSDKQEIGKLKQRVLNYGASEEDAKKFIIHVDEFLSKYKKDDKGNKIFNKLDAGYAYKAFVIVDTVGLKFDGINAVFTGWKRFFFTADGYKNKVLLTYPETKFDLQLVNDGDDFKIAKESGSIIYTHNISDPFGNNKRITGAYVVLKTDRGEYFESINQDTFNKMKNNAMNSQTWDMWASEFWLKSVVKRACKRHFKDVTIEIDKLDNSDYGIDSEKATNEELDDIVSTHTNS